VAWSADGRLASASYDGTVIVWDLSTGEPAQTLQRHAGSISSLAWSADGRLASASADNTIKIARGDLLKMNMCDWIYRNLTVKEWLAYQGALYIYRPACTNLPSPLPNPTIGDVMNYILSLDIYNLELTLISWKGRGILSGIAVLLIAILTGIVWMLRKLTRWARRRIRKRVHEEPGVV
jgi:WD40 repeat protein